jgi:hypothetical protein
VYPPQGVNLASFSIRVKNSSRLDYEKVKSLSFSLVAREVVAVDPKESRATVTVHVKDQVRKVVLVSLER